MKNKEIERTVRKTMCDVTKLKSDLTEKVTRVVELTGADKTALACCAFTLSYEEKKNTKVKVCIRLVAKKELPITFKVFIYKSGTYNPMYETTETWNNVDSDIVNIDFETTTLDLTSVDKLLVYVCSTTTVANTTIDYIIKECSINIIGTRSNYETSTTLIHSSSLIRYDIDAVMSEYYKTQHPLYMKTINVIGDSMVEGHTLKNSQNIWRAMLAKKYHCKVFNYGVNGTYLSNHDFVYGKFTNNGACIRYTNMLENVDYIIAWCGINDAANSITIGTIDSTDDTTFYGGAVKLVDGLLTKYPKSKILFITPLPSHGASADPYREALKAVLDDRNVPYVDSEKCGLCLNNTKRKTALTLGDSFMHLNEAGHAYMLSVIEDALLRI